MWQKWRLRHRPIDTRWIVISGAPASGKTSLANALADLGYRVVADQARETLQGLIKTGLSKGEARADYMTVQRQILRRMLAAAAASDPTERIFFDYALPDNLAFLEAAGLAWQGSFIQAACRYKYERAFLLDLLPEIVSNTDSVRVETTERRKHLQQVFAAIYTELGIPITVLSPTPVSERLKAVKRILALSDASSTIGQGVHS